MFAFFAQEWFFWTVAGLIALCGCLLLYRGVLRDRSRGRPRCPRCWYDLSGAPSTAAAQPTLAAVISLPVTCPECGHTATKPRQLRRTRRHRLPILAGLLVLGLAVYSYEIRHRLVLGGESWKTALIPSTAYVLGLEWIDKKTFDVVESRFANRVLPNKGTPEGHGFWKWQEGLYRQSLSRIVDRGQGTLPTDALHLLLRMASADDDEALHLFISHLDHPNVAVRRQAISWAQSLDAKMRAGRDEVLARLGDEDELVRQGTVWIVMRMGASQCDGLSDEKLCDVAGQLIATGVSNGMARDWYLTEMVARRSPLIVRWLRAKVADPPRSRWADVPSNLELVTALRRVEGRDDPLTITVEPAELRSKDGKLPVVKVFLRNRDPDGLEVGFQRHGDNRGERPMRWRFEVRNTSGTLMPIILESMNFGGLSSYGTLKPGEVFDNQLDMSKYIPPLPPGEYRVIVQYHDDDQISTQADVSRMVVARSKEVKLIVEP